MDQILVTIFLLNNILFFSAIVYIDWITSRNASVVSISDLVRTGKDGVIFLEILLMTGNIIHVIFSLYLLVNVGFPTPIVFGAFAGVIGFIVSFLRIDKHYRMHTILTIVVFIFCSGSMLVTSSILANPVLIAVSLLQILGTFIGYGLRLRTKHIEVIYFGFFGIWNILVLVSYLK